MLSIDSDCHMEIKRTSQTSPSLSVLESQPDAASAPDPLGQPESLEPEEREARQQADCSLRLFEAALLQASDAIAILDAQNDPREPRIAFVNPAFTHLTGYPAVEVLGSTLDLLIGPKTHSGLLNHLYTDLAQGKPFHDETIAYCQNGVERYVELRCAPIQTTPGKITHYIVIQQDITDRKQFEQQLFHQAFYDSLTNLPNRAFFLEKLNAAIAKANDCRDYSFALLFLDVNRFKTINDTLGHALGDRLLVGIANRLRDCLTPDCFVARLGGDEFAILAEHVSCADTAAAIAQRVHQTLAQPFNLEGLEVFSSVSIGIALSNWRGDDLKTLLRDADTAMYHAKASGQASRYVVFDRSMHDKAVEKVQAETDLRYALEHQQLALHYQPIFSLENQKLVGFEALIRWPHPQRGMVSPDTFLPLAEETGLIVPVGNWVIQMACAQIAQWNAEFSHTSPLFISIHLSSKQLTQPDFLADVIALMGTCQLDARCLRFEITEDAIIEEVDLAIERLWQLRKLGIGLSLDDFGTGYASLSYLQRFPVDRLKIDRLFVSQGRDRAKEDDADSMEFTQAIMSLARSLDMNVTAEGIETETQYQKLRALGCQYGQGYFFSVPLTSTEAQQLLVQRAVLASS